MTPLESRARYRYVQRPTTRTSVSSTRQEVPVRFSSLPARGLSWGAEVHPPPEGGVIEAQTSLPHELCQVPIAERETEVHAHPKDDDFISTVPSPEECRPIIPPPLT